MNYAVEKTDKSKVCFTITLDAQEWETSLSQAYLKNKSKYSLQGFRKGHVPRKVLEGIYGQGLFFEDAINIALPKYYTEVLDKEQDIFPVESPDIDVKEVGENGGVTFTATVTVKPEVKIAAYKGIKVEKPEYNVTDGDISDELGKAQERASRLVSAEGRAAAKGDTVIIDYSGSIDGVKFEGGTAEKHSLELGSGNFIPGFEEQVEGLNLGESKDINVKFPENYAPALAGKDAVFAITLHEIKEKQVPALDDEFAKDVSEFDTLDAYKADIAKKLSGQNEKKQAQEFENNIIEEITKLSECDVPEAMVLSQVDSMVQEMEYRMMYQGMKLDDYLKYTNSTIDKLKESYKEQAAITVKTRLVLEQLVKELGIKADDAEVEAKIAAQAEQAKKSAEEYKKNLGDKQLDYISNDIIMDKLFAALKQEVEAVSPAAQAEKAGAQKTASAASVKKAGGAKKADVTEKEREGEKAAAKKAAPKAKKSGSAE